MIEERKRFLKRKHEGTRKKKKKASIGIILQCIGIVIGTLIVAGILIVAIVRLGTYFSNHITKDEGVDEGIYVELGGQEQYLLIRGENVNNPVIVWLHGGPASPDTYVNYVFEKYLVDEYTVINWDQRGCGRTYYHNIENDPKNETVSFEQAQADIDALVDYARERFNKEKVIIVGQSYGTMLGSRYSLDNPDKVLSYIGVGQVVNAVEGDTYSYEDALLKASNKGDDTSLMTKAYDKFAETPSLANVMALRELTKEYHKEEINMGLIWKGIISPYMWFNDFRWFIKQVGDLKEFEEMNAPLFDYCMKTDIKEQGLEYKVPVGFITGSEDWITPAELTEEYLDTLFAPVKRMKVIEDVGHMPQLEAPELFCGVLKDMLQFFSR